MINDLESKYCIFGGAYGCDMHIGDIELIKKSLKK